MRLGIGRQWETPHERHAQKEAMDEPTLVLPSRGAGTPHSLLECLR